MQQRRDHMSGLKPLLGLSGTDTVRDDGLLCEEDGTVTVRDSLDALLQVCDALSQLVSICVPV